MSREDAQMKIRLPAELRDRIVEAATAGKRTLNAEIVSRLAESFAPQPDMDELRVAVATFRRMNDQNLLFMKALKAGDEDEINKLLAESEASLAEARRAADAAR